MMTADQHCRIEAVSPDGRLIRHSCLIEPGDSGGPILRSSEDQAEVVGINIAVPFVGANRAAARNEDFRGGIAVSAASIVASLAGAPSRKP